MDHWTASWKTQLSQSFHASFYPSPPPSPPPLLSLPPEILRTIILLALPCHLVDQSNNYNMLWGFLLLSRISRSIRGILTDPAFQETFYKRVLTEYMLIGRPLDEKRSYTELGRELLGMYLEYRGKHSHLVHHDRSMDEVYANPRTFVEGNPKPFRDEYLGIPNSSFSYVELHSVDFSHVLTPTETHHKTMNHIFPDGSPTRIPSLAIYPRSLRPYTQPPQERDPWDISIGMTHASRPAMREMKVFVFLGGVCLGDYAVRNREGVTVRDHDGALGEFMDQPTPRKTQTHLLTLLPTLHFLHPHLTNRELIQRLANPEPKFLPLIHGGKTAVKFFVKMTKWGEGRRVVEGVDVMRLFGVVEDDEEEP